MGHCVRSGAGVVGAGKGGFESMRFLDIIPAAARARAMECLAATLRGEAAAFEFSLDAESRSNRHFECRYLPNSSGQVLGLARVVEARKGAERGSHRPR